MSQNSPSFYGKVLLFGEYGVILGSKALSIPFHQFSGKLEFYRDYGFADNEQQDSNSQLRHFYSYLFENSQENWQIDLERFRQDLERGLYFKSNIPQGYGAGSSGALVASIYHRYNRNPVGINPGDDFRKLKKTFSEMESFFHGKSSGLDPLICYAGEPLLVGGESEIKKVKLPEMKGPGFFLLNTGLKSRTGPLVDLFLGKLKEQEFQTRIREEYIPLTHACIEHLLNGNYRELKDNFARLSTFQQEYFLPMIPDNFLPLWQKGRKNGSFHLKLCGSGGGGYLLGYSHDIQMLSGYIEDPYQPFIIFPELS